MKGQPVGRSAEHYSSGTSSEALLVAVFLLGFLAFNVWSAPLYPFPHIDECMFVEPAINFVNGHGFGIRFSEMVSLYSFLLVPWIKLFGFSIRSIRAADVFFMTASFAVLWSAVRRLDIVGKVSSRYLMLVLVATEFGVIVSYRTGRYDGFGAFLLAGCMWVMSLKGRRARLISLATICMWLPWAGLQYLPVVFSLGAVLLLMFPRQYWKEIAAAFSGVAVGVAGFFTALSASGQLKSYLHFVQIQRRDLIGNLIKYGRFDHSNVIPKDFSLPFLGCGAAVLFFFLIRKKAIAYRSALGYSLLYTAVLSFVLVVTSKFPTYYAYTVSIPLIVGISSSLPLCRNTSARYVVAGLCAMSVFAGLGLNITAYAKDRRERDYAHVDNFVRTVIHAGDTAFVDQHSYYTAKVCARDVYFSNPDWPIFPLMSQQQKDSISVIVVHSENAATAIQGLGRNWSETGEQLVPSTTGIFDGKGMGFISLPSNHLVVFRRR